MMLKQLLFILLFFNAFLGYSQIGWKNEDIIDNTGKIAPENVVTADVNSDGFMDLVVGAQNGLCWFRNLDGQGNFSSSIKLDTNSNPLDINVVDINGDGYRDIVYTKSISNARIIVWLKNNSNNGTFAPPVTLATNNWSVKIQVIDIDNDGDSDIVYNTSTNLAVLKNSGSALFTSQNAAAAVVGFYLIDVNGDQLPDLITKDTYNLRYFMQNAAGAFVLQETMDSFVVNNYGNTFITGGDIDNDGDTDIAVIHENGNDQRIKWYKNTNNVFANFLTLTLLPVGNGTSSADSRNIILKDMDSDGWIDVVLQNSFLNRISWFKNSGTTGFGTEQIISSTIVNPRSIAVADFNGDSTQDIATVGGTNNDVIWLNNGSGTAISFATNQLSQFVIFPNKISVGDIDGDGIKDVLVTSANDHKLSWYRNTDGLGAFSEGQKIITNTLINAQNGLILDLNNDGKNDILAYSNPFAATPVRKIVQYINQGNGVFGAEQVIFSTATSSINRLEGIDVDNDGDLDLVCSFFAGDIKVFKNNGNGTYGVATSFVESGGYFVPSDVDNDGDLDLIVSSTTAFFWLENTDGLGNFSVKHPVTMNLALPRKFVVGDIDNDGLKEVIYTNNNLGKITINADGTFGTQSTFSALGNSNLIDMADLDNDGDLDIVCSAATNNNTPGFTLARFRYYQNLGNGTFGPPTEIYFENINDIPFFNGFTSLAIADINGDGKKDIFLSISYFTKVMWFKNKGPFLNEISGNVDLDVSNNGCVSGSNAAQQILVSTSESGVSLSTFTQSNGSYVFKVGAGIYTTEVASPTLNYPSNPAFIVNNLVGINNGVTADFCLQPIQLFDDLVVSLYPINDARPGFVAKYVMVVKNKGTNVINSTVMLNFNSSKLQFLSANQIVLNQTPSFLHFAVTNLQPFEQFETQLEFQVNPIPTVTLGEIITFSASNIFSTDSNPENNTFVLNQMIVGAYDPNDITVLEGEEVLISNSDKYLHYIIRFQNTGNYFAERVVITVPIDADLDWQTMELESYSHNQRAEITDGNLITFVFDAIYLPGQSQDEAGSNGYIAFKIKPKNTVNVGTIVQKSASIYFDFNPPILTNQVATEYVEFLGTQTFETQKIVVYPNPVKNVLQISGIEKQNKIHVYNTLGQIVFQSKNANSVDFTEMPTGIYLLEILSETKKTQVIRVLKH